MRDPLDARLEGTPFAGRIVRHARLTSTIDECRALADAGSSEGCVVLASSQSAGRGQRGNSWHSARGAGLYLSALLRPPLAPSDLALIPLAVGLAACEALRSLGVVAWMKHPNDLLVVDRGAWRKIGGLLVDSAVQAETLRHAIVSLGVNCETPEGGFPAGIVELATSLSALGAVANPDDVAAAFLPRLATWRRAMEESPASWAEDLRARHAALLRDIAPGQAADAKAR